MSDINVRRVPDLEDRSLPVFAEVERLMLDIGRRARELFAARGGDGRHELDDWLQAEHEICWPAAQLVERDRDFALSVALPGYEPTEVELTVTPREAIVHARHEAGPGVAGRERGEGDVRVRWSDFRADDVYRRFELPQRVDVERVKATLRHGMLKITAPKTEAVVATIPIAA
jgi:HSP20 family molecular chaperone IbpA